MNGGSVIYFEIALGWMPLDFTDDKSTLVLVMAWTRISSCLECSQLWFEWTSFTDAGAPCRDLAVDYDTLSKLLYVFRHKTSQVLIHAHIPTLWYFDTSVTYPIDFAVKFVLIPPRFIYQQHLWNIAIQPAVVMTHELIYGVRAAHR